MMLAKSLPINPPDAAILRVDRFLFILKYQIAMTDLAALTMQALRSGDRVRLVRRKPEKNREDITVAFPHTGQTPRYLR
jgi:hypothetical protein